jgi:hypothetical protein
MGSKRTLEDKAAQTAAAEVGFMPPANAAAVPIQQPSSSQEQFVNTGVLADAIALLTPRFEVLVSSPNPFWSCVQDYKPGWNVGGNGLRSPLTSSGQQGRELTRRCPRPPQDMHVATPLNLPRSACYCVLWSCTAAWSLAKCTPSLGCSPCNLLQ